MAAVKRPLLSGRAVKDRLAPWETAFFSWCLQGATGVDVHPALSVRRLPDLGYDLQASAYVPKGEVLIKVPESCWKPFSAAQAVQDMQGHHAQLFQQTQLVAQRLMPNQSNSANALVQSVCLSLNLLAKLQAGHPYAAFLWQSTTSEEALPHPIRMDSKYLSHLAGTKALEDIMKRQKLYSYVATEVMPATSSLLQQQQQQQMPADLLLWALGIVLSRGISGAQYPFSLVPFLDLANHSDQPNAQHLHSAGDYQLVTTRDLIPQEPITISYGAGRDSASFMTMYGFLGGQGAGGLGEEAYNPNDRLMLPIGSGPADLLQAIVTYLQAAYPVLFQSKAVQWTVNKDGLSAGILSPLLFPAAGSEEQTQQLLQCLLYAHKLTHTQGDANIEALAYCQKDVAGLLEKIDGLLADSGTAGALTGSSAAMQRWVANCEQLQASKRKALMALKQLLSSSTPTAQAAAAPTAQ